MDIAILLHHIGVIATIFVAALAVNVSFKPRFSG
jgi:hypothetical protein